LLAEFLGAVDSSTISGNSFAAPKHEVRAVD
jgi:hypothetical protein